MSIGTLGLILWALPLVALLVLVVIAAFDTRSRPRDDVEPQAFRIHAHRDWARRLAEDDEVAALDAMWDMPPRGAA